MEPAKVKESVRIGENLELDLSTGQLCRASRVLKIERIPMAVLLLLVQRRGEVVSRDQIVQIIWGKDVYLDTDNAINGAIRKIRQVLRDDPEQPRFIQTITGTGYRFIAPVIAPDAEAESAPVIAAQQSDGTEVSANSFPGNRKHVLAVLLLAAAILAIVSVAIYPRSFGLRAWSSHTGERTMLAVLPFENLTGDAN